jgi:hypothetical protein
MEHYNRSSSNKRSVRVENTIEDTILSTSQSQKLQKQILKDLEGNDFFIQFFIFRKFKF